MRNKTRYIALLALVTLVMVAISPVALAKTRSSHLVDFIYSTQNTNDQTFGITWEHTARALQIIGHYGSWEIPDLFGEDKTVDKETLGETLNTELLRMFDEDVVNLHSLLYILDSLRLIDIDLDDDLEPRILLYFNQTAQVGGGFSFTNTSTSANMAPTFFIMKSYAILHINVPNITSHKNWILSCSNSDGGYGGNETASSTITTTYQAVTMIDMISSTDDLVNESATLEYLKGFFVDDVNNHKNYGGYRPDQISDNALLSSTFYCADSIIKIENNQYNKEPTTKWVISQQNFQDGGFSDNTINTDQKLSSIISSSHAFNTLAQFDALSTLEENAFAVVFDPTGLLIFLIVVAVAIIILVIIMRRRKRI